MTKATTRSQQQLEQKLNKRESSIFFFFDAARHMAFSSQVSCYPALAGLEQTWKDEEASE